MKKLKKHRKPEATLQDVFKAIRRGSREAEQELLGPGFHATSRVHRSKKTYSRKEKHRQSINDQT